MSVPTIAPTALAELLSHGKPDEQIDLIDVRTPAEYAHVHATPARNIPLDQLDPDSVMRDRPGPPERPLYVICHSGSRGQQACQKLQKAGYVNVVNVEGGTTAWQSCGLPVVRGKKTLSLERQVRIAAGLLVCIGALLAWLLHPAFIALSAFVGAGLVFAGLTDTCGMALLLARMPWNRTTEVAVSCKTPATAEAMPR
ncbi:MAG: rhodanese-like domain-containing protein [Planctomycetaceae bacterium]|nr:rhodanese-like domain-containing protein [Planctomycetaceae bacterium]